MSENLGVSPALRAGAPKESAQRPLKPNVLRDRNSAGFAALLTFPGIGFSH